MAQTLISTKFRAPKTRPRLVERPRLRETLERGARHKLTLVSAPAGFGKTTLLVEWFLERASTGGAVVWVTLEESDNDPTRFLSYLVGALRSVEERIGEAALAALRTPELPPIEPVLGTLINDLAAAGREIRVFLDDYHLIDARPVHEALAFFLEHLPDNVGLVIATRTDPPVALATLRARDQVTEIRAADLRFTTDESAAFLNDVMGLSLSTGEIAALEAATEGWAAALQLAALSMRDREDAPTFVASFSGSNRHVLDFLAEEVLERQPEDVREFLLKTSVLGRMSAPLCEALTGRSDGQGMLERLERENLFVVPLDDERVWYRYHHLFADFLRGRLRVEDPTLAGTLHLRAAGWYEIHGLSAEAIEHALSASDPELAARLIEGEARRAFGRGEVPTVLRWLEALPTEAKHRRPRLLLQHALALALTGRPEEVEALLQEAERTADNATSEGEDRRFLLGYVSAVRSWCARLRGDAPRAVALARRAVALLPAEEGGMRTFAAVCLGDTLWTTGDLVAAGEALAAAAEIGRSAGHVYGMLSAMTLHARVQAERGRLRESDETLRRALRFVAEQRVEWLPAAGAIHIGMGALHYERNELDEAERALKTGIALAERTRNVTDLVWGMVTLSRAKRARGDDESALATALTAERVARDYGADLEIALAHAWMTRLRSARGDLAGASASEREYAGHTAGAAWMVDRIASARLLHARGRHDEALRLLDALQAATQAAVHGGGPIEILVVRALALWAANKHERGVHTVAAALALAEPEGYVRTFVDEGAPMGDLLTATLEARQGDHRDAAGRVSIPYLARLLAALADEAAVPAADERLPEPLSGRELEVLALIAAGKTNTEIAATLFVSTSTVKTHINKLYRKLGARSRTQALARAREMDLL